MTDGHSIMPRQHSIENTSAVFTQIQTYISSTSPHLCTHCMLCEL